MWRLREGGVGEGAGNDYACGQTQLFIFAREFFIAVSRAGQCRCPFRFAFALLVKNTLPNAVVADGQIINPRNSAAFCRRKSCDRAIFVGVNKLAAPVFSNFRTDGAIECSGNYVNTQKAALVFGPQREMNCAEK